MKEIFLNYSLGLIKNYNPNYDDTKLAELKFGLEGFYITITKLIIICTLAIIFNIFKEMILMLLFFNILRTTGFGLHAKKGYVCLISSSLIFIVIPLISKIIDINIYLKVFLGILAIILIFIYAPADTLKRPLVNKDRRNKYKFITTINTIILVELSIITNDSTLANLIIFGIYCEVILILPITYKISHLPYRNYKNYIKV